MASRSDVLDHHLQCFGERKRDGILADESREEHAAVGDFTRLRRAEEGAQAEGSEDDDFGVDDVAIADGGSRKIEHKRIE